MSEKFSERIDSKERSEMRTHWEALYARLTPEYKKNPRVDYKEDLGAKKWDFAFTIGEGGVNSFTEGVCKEMFGKKDFSGLTQEQREYVDNMVYVVAVNTGLDMNRLNRGETFEFKAPTQKDGYFLQLSIRKNGQEIYLGNLSALYGSTAKPRVIEVFGSERMSLSEELENSSKKKLIDAATRNGSLVSVMQAFTESVSLENRKKMLQGLEAGKDAASDWRTRADKSTINGINEYLRLHFEHEKNLTGEALEAAMDKHRLNADGTAYRGTAEQNQAWVRFIRNDMYGYPSEFSDQQRADAQKLEFREGAYQKFDTVDPNGEPPFEEPAQADLPVDEPFVTDEPPSIGTPVDKDSSALNEINLQRKEGGAVKAAIDKFLKKGSNRAETRFKAKLGEDGAYIRDLKINLPDDVNLTTWSAQLENGDWNVDLKMTIKYSNGHLHMVDMPKVGIVREDDGTFRVNLTDEDLFKELGRTQEIISGMKGAADRGLPVSPDGSVEELAGSLSLRDAWANVESALNRVFAEDKKFENIRFDVSGISKKRIVLTRNDLPGKHVVVEIAPGGNFFQMDRALAYSPDGGVKISVDGVVVESDANVITAVRQAAAKLNQMQ